MGLFILAVVMFITNLLGVYFTFKTWYGKQSKDIPVILDELGNIEIDKDRMKRDEVY
jgi:hypothetical protein